MTGNRDASTDKPVTLFRTMADNSRIKGLLIELGLNDDEAAILICLLNAPKTLLEVSRVTGIARSSVYRLVDGLISKSIVHELTTENGKVLASVDPEALELLVVEQEKAAEARRAGFNQLIPLLSDIKNQDSMFATRTYGGVAGLKQMLWNELKTKGEILMFSCGPLELVTGRRWAEKYRAEIIHRRIMQRSIENTKPRHQPLSAFPEYDNFYIVRQLPKELLTIHHELTIHDDTISIYNSWTDHTQLGTEIKNPFLANFMRQVFEQYWKIAEKS